MTQRLTDYDGHDDVFALAMEASPAAPPAPDKAAEAFLDEVARCEALADGMAEPERIKCPACGQLVSTLADGHGPGPRGEDVCPGLGGVRQRLPVSQMAADLDALQRLRRLPR